MEKEPTYYDRLLNLSRRLNETIQNEKKIIENMEIQLQLIDERIREIRKEAKQ